MIPWHTCYFSRIFWKLMHRGQIWQIPNANLWTTSGQFNWIHCFLTSFYLYRFVKKQVFFHVFFSWQNRKNWRLNLTFIYMHIRTRVEPYTIKITQPFLTDADVWIYSNIEAKLAGARFHELRGLKIVMTQDCCKSRLPPDVWIYSNLEPKWSILQLQPISRLL